MNNTRNHEEYDLEPVSYCPKCYSLKIGYVPGVEGMEYCMDCGCLDIASANIYDWEKLYEDRYGHKYVVKRNKDEGHPIWGLSMKDLRRRVLESPYYKDIIKEIYPNWKYYGNVVDTVFLFMDNVLKDKLVSKLKKILIARYREGTL